MATKGAFPRGVVQVLADEVDGAMLRCAGGVTQGATIAGSMRRGAQVVGDLDLVVVVGDDRDRTNVMLALAAIGEPTSPWRKSAGRQKCSIWVETPLREVMQGRIRVDVVMCPQDELGAALLYLTGSKEFNVAMRGYAVGRGGLTLNEHGLFDGSKRIAGEAEQDVFRALELRWVPPEYRTGYRALTRLR